MSPRASPSTVRGDKGHTLRCGLLMLVLTTGCNTVVAATKGLPARTTPFGDTAHHRAKRSANYYDGVSGVDKEMRKIMLSEHNRYRGLQKASNMMFMTWDDDLEEFAQTYAEKCVFKHSAGSDRSDYRGFKYIGENFLFTSNHNEPVKAGLFRWYNETHDYNYDDLSCKTGKMCGHYTQMVWHNSNKLGCGVKHCDKVAKTGYNGRALFVVCVYGPGGNIDDIKPFKKGKACADCPNTPNYCIRGLCSKIPQIGHKNGSSRLCANKAFIWNSLVCLALVLGGLAQSQLR